MIHEQPMKATYDLVFDNIVKILGEYSDSMPTYMQFGVIADCYRSSRVSRGAIAYVYWNGNTYEKNGTVTKNRVMQYDARYYIDCISAAIGTMQGTTYKDAGAAANERNRYLVHQVIMALSSYKTVDMGLPVGTIGGMKLRVESVDPVTLETEDGVAGCRLVLDISMSDIPQTDEGVALEELYVSQETAPQWGVVFKYE